CPSQKNIEITGCHYHEYKKSSLMYHCASENLYYQLKERIKDMKPQDIVYFTKEFILKFAPTKIDRIWNKLPEKLQKDEDIIACRRCHKHYNPMAIDYDEIEDIIPFMKDCSICKEEK
ncbi:hypothetical protein PV327_011645, partial [Microctonus hyperodae]